MPCPIPTTHSRLKEAHRLWHQASTHYDDPEGFRTYLNAAIQALRNVTFALQKEHAIIPAFDAWYEPWQKRLRDDPICRWLITARNLVVKEQDLAARSTARIATHQYAEFSILERDVPPNIPSEVVAEKFRTQMLASRPEGVPEDTLHGMILSVERKWVAESLPSHELLEALAHIYDVLRTLVNDAHNRAGAQAMNCGSEDTLHPPSEDMPQAPAACFAFDREGRTARLDLMSGRRMQVSAASAPSSPEMGRLAGERYGTDEGSLITASVSDTAQRFLDMGKRILAKDGHHGHFIFLRTLDGEWVPGPMLGHADRMERYVLMQTVAGLVRSTRATGVLAVGEMWRTPLSEYTGEGSTPNSEELLAVTVALQTGEVLHYTATFTHDSNGTIQFEATKDESHIRLYWLDPIRAVWNLPTSMPDAKDGKSS
jgi:hypothetical protein